MGFEGKRKQRERESKGVPAAASGELVEFAAAGEDEEGEIEVAENGELAGLLDEPGSSLGESDLPTALVLD